jgi:hypothetical protein
MLARINPTSLIRPVSIEDACAHDLRLVGCSSRASFPGPNKQSRDDMRRTLRRIAQGPEDVKESITTADELLWTWMT